jgi:hypothetical protein
MVNWGYLLTEENMVIQKTIVAVDLDMYAKGGCKKTKHS